MGNHSNYQFELFQQSWSIYQQILDGNYMFHKQISADLNQFCRNYFSDQTINLIDLGCGDASQSIPIFYPLNISHYLACDVSQTALDLAALNLQKTGWPYTFQCLDMLTGLQNQTDQVDLIYCSFSMHHLDTSQKQQLFLAASQLLNIGGLLIVVDVIRDEQQSLSDYHKAYLSHAQQHWPSLTDNDFATLRRHVITSDLPETFTQLKALGKQAGFKQAELINKNTWHVSSVFYKNAH